MTSEAFETEVPMNPGTYHPDSIIDAEVRQEVAEAEAFDIRAGQPAWWWQCPECLASHNRGHFGEPASGAHRCLRCGYTGAGGIMAPMRHELPNKHAIKLVSSTWGRWSGALCEQPIGHDWKEENQ